MDRDMEGPHREDFRKDVSDDVHDDERPGPGTDSGPGPAPGPRRASGPREHAPPGFPPPHHRHAPGQPTGPYPRPHMPQGRPPSMPGWRPPFPTPPVPPPPIHPPVPPPGEPRGFMWAFVPFLTFGMGTPFSFLYAAVRRHSLHLGAIAGSYGAGTAAWMLMALSDSSVLSALSIIMMMMLWVAGSVHAFAVRPSVFPREPPQNVRNEHAIKYAKYRRALREEARALVAEDPALAHELRIGRPDLPRGYDDGGLIDVNHVPPATLAMLPGLDDEIIDRIVRRRTEQGGFISAEEMAVDIDLPPGLLPQIAEYAVFLP
ncbi:hypothetical protein [Actinomadura sp. SCN-SB]|uniref:hypothetical protein n=1 Tax=Actinomadura sp. SCN-SB TaxID=3373092 RepID=UPI003751CD51